MDGRQHINAGSIINDGVKGRVAIIHIAHGSLARDFFDLPVSCLRNGYLPNSKNSGLPHGALLSVVYERPSADRYGPSRRS